MQSNIVYKIINVRKIRYALLILLFFVLLATYPNTIELIMVAITASDGLDDDIQVFPIFINSFPEITSGFLSTER